MVTFNKCCILQIMHDNFNDSNASDNETERHLFLKNKIGDTAIYFVSFFM